MNTWPNYQVPTYTRTYTYYKLFTMRLGKNNNKFHKLINMNIPILLLGECFSRERRECLELKISF